MTRPGAATWFLGPDRTWWGSGDATTIDLPAPWPAHVDRVAEKLDAIGSTPDGGPVAFGALPFDTDAPARFTVPERLWSTEPPRPEPAPERARSTVVVQPTIPPDEWTGLVAAARDHIAAGELTKVVLAREIEIRGSTGFDPVEVARLLAAAHPGALRFCVDGFVGASPELLVSRSGDVVRAQPMAGTTPRSGDAGLDTARAEALRISVKNREEHQITIDVTHDALLPWCSYLDAEPEPSVVAAGSVQHLATAVEGRLSHPIPSVLELVAALHPTPAVGGWPRDRALRLIRQLEQAPRGRYGGPVGWVDREGNGTFAVGIRSAEISGDRARVLAGVGVVADSDPIAELEETRAKFAATLGAFVRL